MLSLTCVHHMHRESHQWSTTYLRSRLTLHQWDSFGGSDGKESTCNVGDQSLIPGSGRSPGEGNCNSSSILVWKIPCVEEPGGL